MSTVGEQPLRVALLAHEFADQAHAPASRAAAAVAHALASAGEQPTVITSHAGPGATEVLDGVRVARVRRLPEALLRFRGFVTPLSHLPFSLAALRDGGFDVAHSFSPIDTWAALRWRSRGGGPVVFTCAEPPSRENLADRRQQLAMVTRAFRDSGAVTATTEEVRDAVRRWLAIEVPIVDLGDAQALKKLYAT